MVKMVQLYRIQKYTSLAHPMGNVFVVLVAFSIAGVSQANMAHFENSSYLNVVEGMPFEDFL